MPAASPDDARRLEELDLSSIEARVYLALLSGGTLGAQAVAQATGITRTSAYAALRSLAEQGLVEAGAGYGSRYRAVAPERALPSLVDRQRQGMAEVLEARERVAKELAEELADLPRGPSVPGEVVEIIRNARAMSERFDRLQLEAEREIATVVKAPIVTSGDPNPAQEVALRRGVRVRGLYEEAVLDHEEIRPYLEAWVAAGEEARVYPGELLLKFAVFDSKTVLLPLETPGDRHPFTTLLIRHDALGAGLRLLYDLLWERSRRIGRRRP